MVPPGGWPAIVGRNAIKHSVVTLDYRQGPNAMKKTLLGWLDTPTSKKLFGRYYKRPIPKQNVELPDRFKELLKFLAAWRLYDELGFKGAKDWTKMNRREYESGSFRVRPFFREKRRKRPGGQYYYGGALFEEKRQWQSAMDGAQAFLENKVERASGMM